MASANLAKLQATVNRYASAAGFAPIAVDGGMGSNTIAATQRALVFAANEVESGAAPRLPDFEHAMRQSDSASFIMTNVVDLNTELTKGADNLGLARPQSVALVRPPVAGIAADPGAFKIGPPPGGLVGAALVQWHKIPDLLKVGVLAGVVLGGAYWYKRRRGRAAAPTQNPRRRRRR
jgi:hypothetical protein